MNLKSHFNHYIELKEQLIRVEQDHQKLSLAIESFLKETKMVKNDFSTATTIEIDIVEKYMSLQEDIDGLAKEKADINNQLRNESNHISGALKKLNGNSISLQLENGQTAIFFLDGGKIEYSLKQP